MNGQYGWARLIRSAVYGHRYGWIVIFKACEAIAPELPVENI